MRVLQCCHCPIRRGTSASPAVDQVSLSHMREPSHMMPEAGDQGMLPEVSFKLPGPPQCSQKLLLYAAHLPSTFLLQHVAYTFLNLICVSQNLCCTTCWHRSWSELSVAQQHCSAGLCITLPVNCSQRGLLRPLHQDPMPKVWGQHVALSCVGPG